MNLKEKNIMRMLITDEHIQFVPDEHSTGFSQFLTLKRKDYTIDTDFKQILSTENVVPVFGIVGIYQIYGKQHLFIINEVKPIKLLNNLFAYKIKGIQSFSQQYDKINYSDVEKRQIGHITKYMSKCTYFSYCYDLTLPLNLQTKNDQMERSVRFWWNFNGLKSLLAQNISKEWCLKIIQGHIGYNVVTLRTCFNIKFNIISRREWMRGGTRYNHRGIDEHGAAANTVETEQIIIYKGNKYSHIQVRGSVPIFWQQIGIRAISEITKNQQISQEGFILHCEQLRKYYKKILFVNLMSKDKQNENIITQNYEEILKNSKLDYVTYSYIDFHNVCKNYKFINMNPLILKYEQLLKEFSFTKFSDENLIQLQQGIVRTNCLDCLDRTNVFQNKISFYALQMIFEDIGLNFQEELQSQDTLLNISENLKIKSEIIDFIKQQWSETGNQISKLYAGTDSSTTKMSKHGGNGFTGMFHNGITGLQRFYKQNFTDQEKQNIYQFIIGNSQTSRKEFEGYINQVQQQMQQRSIQNILVMIVSLNMQNLQSSDINFEELIQFQQNPEFVIICLQNVNYNCLPIQFIRDLINKAIKNILGLYEQVIVSSSHSQFIIVFGKNRFASLIEKISNDILYFEQKEIGYQTTIIFDQFKIVILNLNIDSTNFSKYIYQIEEKLGSFDIGFICGINNFKIKLNTNLEDFIEKEQTDIISKIYQLDELCRYLQTVPFLIDFQEPIITFLPHPINHWYSRILYGSSISLDIYSEICYEEVKFKKRNGIKCVLALNLCELEQASKKISIGSNDIEEMRLSEIYFNKSQIIE